VLSRHVANLQFGALHISRTGGRMENTSNLAHKLYMAILINKKINWPQSTNKGAWSGTPSYLWNGRT